MAFYVVMLLGAYQLMSSGLLGGVPSERMGPVLRAAMLGGLVLLLAPLLLLWLQSGPLLVRQPCQPSAVDEERAELMGESLCHHICIFYCGGDYYIYAFDRGVKGGVCKTCRQQAK